MYIYHTTFMQSGIVVSLIVLMIYIYGSVCEFCSTDHAREFGECTYQSLKRCVTVVGCIGVCVPYMYVLYNTYIYGIHTQMKTILL